MSPNHVRIAVAMAVLALALGSTAPAGAWDNTYGERTDSNSFSAIHAAVEAPDGGLYLAGWYYGDFEGLSRPGSYGVFLMEVDADGAVENIWDLYESGGTWDGELALGPNGELWMAPGEHGGAARIEDGALTTQLSYGRILGATSQLLLVGNGGDSFRAVDFSGADQWSWSMSDALASEGIHDAGINEFEVVADPDGIFATGAWTSNYPYANEDGGAWKIGPDGETVWSTAIIDDSQAFPAPESVLTPERFVVMAWGGDIWEFDRATGTLSLLEGEQFVKACGQDGDTTWYAVSYPRDTQAKNCPEGTKEVAQYYCSFGDGGPLPGFGSRVEERAYRNCGHYVVRWHRGDSHWIADVASAPFGAEPGDDSALWGGFETSSGSVVLYGQVDNTATFRTSSQRTASNRTPSSSHQYFAAVSSGALDNIPEAAGVHRFAGAGRYETAQAITMARFEPAEVAKVYIATGLDFPDALAGGPLAVQHGAPVLLVTHDTLPSETAQALEALAPDEVIALGGTAVVSSSVLEQAKSQARASVASRIFGENRYATAAQIAPHVTPTGTIYLATGTNFPDALAGGPATTGSPILLTEPTSLPTATRDALAELAPTKIVALGGTSVVSDEVLAEAASAAGGAATDRLSGDDRYETAIDIASTLPSPETVYIATGVNFPDALAAVSAAVDEQAPIVLSDPAALPTVVDTWLRSLDGLRRVVVLGGEQAVSNAVVQQLGDILLA